MAEIKIQKKKRSNIGLVIFIVLLMILAAILLLDATEVISNPDWISETEEVIEKNEPDTNF